MRLDRSAVLACLAIVIGCGSFGEGKDAPAPAPSGPNPDAGVPTDPADAGDLGPIPEDESVDGNTAPGSKTTACALKMQAAGAVFCSDFDDVADPWVGWDRNDSASRYAIDIAQQRSPPNAAKLTIKGATGESPDARLKHELPPAVHFTIRSSVRLSSPAKPSTDAIVVKLQFLKGTLFVRSSGRAIETIPTANGPARFIERLPKADVPFDQWFEMVLDVDLPTGVFDLAVNGVKRTGYMDTKRPAEKLALIAGPADPRLDSAPDLTIWLDDVFVSAP